MPPDILYHYTTAAGLVGIARERAIWATHILHLNDTRELAHALDVAKEIVPEYRDQHPRGTPVALESLEGRNFFDPGVFVASWTEKGDELSQWRGYGGAGPAYSIGFTPSSLQAQADHVSEGLTQGIKWRLEQCIYDPEIQRERLNTTIGNVYRQALNGSYAEPVRSQIHPDNPDSGQVFANALTGAIFQLAPAMKHEKFSGEQEWRLISPRGTSATAHRVGSRMIVPYYEFPLPESDGKLEFSRIVVGPTLEPGLARDAVGSLFVANGGVNGGIQPSKVPYRYW